MRFNGIQLRQGWPTRWRVRQYVSVQKASDQQVNTVIRLHTTQSSCKLVFNQAAILQAKITFNSYLFHRRQTRRVFIPCAASPLRTMARVTLFSKNRNTTENFIFKHRGKLAKRLKPRTTGFSKNKTKAYLVWGIPIPPCSILYNLLS